MFLTVWEPGECVEDVASRRGRHLGLARMTSAEVLERGFGLPRNRGAEFVRSRS